MLTEVVPRWLKTLIEQVVTMLRSNSLEDLPQHTNRRRLSATARKVITTSRIAKAFHEYTDDDQSTRKSSTSGSVSCLSPFPLGGMPSTSPILPFKKASKRGSLAVSLAEDVDFDTQTVRINVGGRIFIVSKESLSRYPNTELGSLTPESFHFQRYKREYYYDRNPLLFDCILDLYRTNELHLPRNICGKAALRELEFWGIPAIWVSACCWSNLHDAINEERLFKDLGGSNTQINLARRGMFRHRLWVMLFNLQKDKCSHHVWNGIIALLLVVSMLTFVTDSKTEIVPCVYFRKYLANSTSSRPEPLPPRRNLEILRAEQVLLATLVLEFTFKVALCPNVCKFFRNMLNTLYALSLLGSCVSHVAESIMETPVLWVEEHSLDEVYVFGRCIRWLRILRLLELLDWNSSLYVMWVATLGCHTEMLLLLLTFVILASIFGATTYFIEQANSHETFVDDLTGGLYWAIITMTTVGYGDITPTTSLGRVVGSICSLCGVIVLALPVAILTESFQQYNLRQKIRQEKRKRQNDFFSDGAFPTPDIKGGGGKGRPVRISRISSI